MSREPTAEEVEAHREMAHAIVGHYSCRWGKHGWTCTEVARFAAAVALEARERGAAEERKACLSIAMARYGRWTKLADGARSADERSRQSGTARECEAIADDIAKRGTS